jgi:uncharacterized protein involved in exopolysaccharide biosynthesis
MELTIRVHPIHRWLGKQSKWELLERVRQDFEEAAHRESLLAKDYAAQTQLVTADGEKSIQYNILKREVDSNRQLYDAMLQKLKESSIASAMRASNVRVVDAAKAPKSPYKPNLELDAGLGLLAGLFLGIVFVVMREREDRTVQEPGECPPTNSKSTRRSRL